MAVDVELGIKVSSEGAEAGSRRVGTALREMGGSAERAQRSVFNLENALRVLATSAAVRQIIEYADTWKLLSARIKIVSTSMSDFHQTQQLLFDMAQRARVPLEAVVSLYTRMARASSDLGLSQQQMIRITETIIKAVTISGATAQEASGALIQLSQAFSEGRLRGQELISIQEQMPFLLDLIAKGSNTSRKEIVKLARDAKLELGQMLSSLLEMGETTDKIFSNIPKTAGAAFVILLNDITKFLGAIDEATGATGGLAQFIIKLGEGFGILARDVEAAASSLRAANAQIAIAGLRALERQIKETEQQLADLGKIAPETIFEKLVFDVDEFKGSMGIAAETSETLKKRLDDLRTAQELLRQSLTHTSEEIASLGLKQGKATKELTEEEKRLTQARQRAEAAAQKEIFALQAAIAIQQRVRVGSLSVAEGQQLMAEAMALAKNKAGALGVEVAKLKTTLDEQTEANKRNLEAFEERQRVLQQLRDAEAERLDALEQSVKALAIEAQEVQRGIDLGLTEVQVQHNIVAAKLENRITTENLSEAEAALARQVLNSQQKVEGLSRSFQNLGKDALVSKNTLLAAFDQIIAGIFQGTQKLGNTLVSLGQGIGVKFFSQLLVGKRDNFDIPLIGNISQLFLGNTGGLIGAIFRQGGIAAVGQFTSGWQGAFNGSGIGSVFKSTGQTAATSFGSSFFQGLGQIFRGNFSQGFSTFSSGFMQFATSTFGKFAIPAAEGFLFAFLARLAGGGKNAQLGAGIGGFLLGPLGGLFGGIIGSFFDSMPTKGTQIRQEMVKWLRKLGVDFAKDIDSDKYGFEWIEAYRKKANLSFLEASREFIPKEFPKLVLAGLDKQLLALGIVSTAKMAEKLKKDVEQTGQSFANMIAQNLVDPEKISAFIADLVQKGEISLGGLVEKLIEVFNKNLIGVDTFKTAVEGAIGIFAKDFPAAAEVARQAFDKAFADGVISAEEFKTALEQAMKHVVTVTGAAADAMSRGIEEGLSAEDATKLFIDNLKKTFREAAIDKFMKDFFGTFFQDINLVDTVLSEEDVQKLADRFKIGFEKLKEILRAAGLLDDELKDWQSRIKATMTEAFSQGIEAGMSAVDAADNFEQLLKKAIRSEAISRFVKEFFDTLFAEGDMSRELLSKEDVEAMADRFKIKYKELRAWLADLGLLPDEEIEDWVGKLKTALEAIPATVGSSLTTAIVEALEKADFKIENVDLSALQQQMEDIVARAVLAAVVGALVEAFVVAPMMAALAPFVAGLTGGAAAAGATVATGGVVGGAALAAGGTTAAAAMIAAATAGLALLREVMNTPEYAAFLEFVRGKFAPGVGAVAGAGSGGGGGGGGEDQEKRRNDLLEEFLKKFEDFISLMEKQENVISKLIDEFNELFTDLTTFNAPSIFQQGGAGPTGGQLIFGKILKQGGDIIRFITQFSSLVAGGWLKGDELKKGIEGIIKSVRDLFSQEGFKLLSDEIKQQVIGLAENLQTALESGDIVGLLETFNKLINELNKISLSAAFAKIEEMILQLQLAFVKKLDQAIDVILDVSGDSLAGNIEGVRSKVEDAIGAIQKMIGDLAPTDAWLKPVLEERIKRLRDGLEAGIRKLVEDFLSPIMEFIEGSERDNPLKKIIDDFQGFFRALTDNRDALEKAGKNVDELLARLTTALGERLAEAVKDLIGQFDNLLPAGESLADQLIDIRKQFGDAIQTLQEALSALPPGSPLTKQIQDMIDLLLGALPNAIKAAAERFLEPMRDFIARGQPEVSRIKALSDEHAKLRQKVLDNAVALAEAGIDVDDILKKLTDSLVVQFAKMRTELLEPITAAIERISPADLRPLADILGEIAGANTLEDLTRIRDAAISNIEERLRREEEAARKATEDNIKLITEQRDAELERLREVQAAEEERLRSQMTMLERLISLREEQMNDEIRALEEQIKVTEDEIRARGGQLEEEKKSIEEITQAVQALREVAQALRVDADALLLSTESPLTPIQRLTEARKQFEEILTRARGGDVEAAKSLAGFGRTLIGEAQGVFASSLPFQDIFFSVRDAMLEVAALNEDQANLLEGSRSLEEKSLEELAQIRKELIDQRDNLTALLGIEERTEEIARLTRELGLTGSESLNQMRVLRSDLDRQLEAVRQTFEQASQRTAAIFDAAIAREQAALEIQLQALRNVAVQELTRLREALGSKFDVLVTQQVALFSELGLLHRELTTAQMDQTQAKFSELGLLLRELLPTGRAVPKTQTPTRPPPFPRPSLEAIAEQAQINANMGLWAALHGGSSFGFPLGWTPSSLQHGGIVTRPTVSLIGEAGPEAVIPLSHAGIRMNNSDLLDELRLLRAEVKELRLQSRGEVVVRGEVRIGEAKIGEIIAKQVEHKISRGGIVPGGRL